MRIGWARLLSMGARAWGSHSLAVGGLGRVRGARRHHVGYSRERAALHPSLARHVDPATAAIGRRRAFQPKPFRQLGDQRTGWSGAQVLVRCAGNQQVEIGAVALADGGREDPAVDRDLDPVVARGATGQLGSTRESRDTAARNILVEPGILDGDAVSPRAL